LEIIQQKQKEGYFMISGKGIAREFKRNWMLFIMLIPAVTYVIIFNYIPMGGIIVAFKNFRFDMGIFGSPWNGIDNFRFFFNSGRALSLTSMTVGYNLAFILTGMFWAVLLALVLSEIRNRYFKKLTHSIIFLPYFISWVVVAFMAYNLFNVQFGVINTMLRNNDMEPVQFYSLPELWRILMVLFSNWKGVGYSSIIYLAVLTGINPEYYEAAQIDGASIWQRIRHISLPFLKTPMVILILLSMGGVFRGGGEMFYQLIGNNILLTPQVDVIDSFILRSLINPVGNINYSMMAAVGLYQQVSGFILILVTNAIARKVNPDGALF